MYPGGIREGWQPRAGSPQTAKPEQASRAGSLVPGYVTPSAQGTQVGTVARSPGVTSTEALLLLVPFSKEN